MLFKHLLEENHVVKTSGSPYPVAPRPRFDKSRGTEKPEAGSVVDTDRAPQLMQIQSLTGVPAEDFEGFAGIPLTAVSDAIDQNADSCSPVNGIVFEQVNGADRFSFPCCFSIVLHCCIFVPYRFSIVLCGFSCVPHNRSFGPVFPVFPVFPSFSSFPFRPIFPAHFDDQPQLPGAQQIIPFELPFDEPCHLLMREGLGRTAHGPQLDVVFPTIHHLDVAGFHGAQTHVTAFEPHRRPMTLLRISMATPQALALSVIFDTRNFVSLYTRLSEYLLVADLRGSMM